MSTATNAANLLSQAAKVKFSFLVAVVLLFYDTAINLSDEISLIWRQQWSLGKLFYILTRYSAFVDAIIILQYSFHDGLTVESCRNLYKAGMWSATVGVPICQLVLVIRTYAIWERSTSVLAYLCSIQVGTLIFGIVKIDEALESVTFTPSPLSTVVPCIPTLGNNMLFIVFCMTVGFELNIICLLLYKGLSQWRGDSTYLIHSLYRDGFISFVVLFSISLANAMIISKFFNSPYYYITIELQRVLHAILASRIIINMREAIALNDLSPRLTKSSSDDSEFINFDDNGEYSCDRAQGSD